MATFEEKVEAVKGALRQVPDFPKPGILFQDITPLIGDGEAFRLTLDLLVERFKNADIRKIVAVESRGFIFGAAMADRMGVGFVPVRKPGKLPYETESATYDLEYGTDTIEIHKDGVGQGERVLLVDDLLATGGTAGATLSLIRKLGAEVVAAAFVVELTDLNGRDKIEGCEVFSLVMV